ncbi:MAG: DUF1501 domain-containing protein [Betaproteobacteria bacterium]|nr:DUF1501 domain-containing protein [Betaproteobacteria bacterium]
MAPPHTNLTRRDLLQALGALGITAGLPIASTRAATGGEKRILVVVELSGANDGLNTLVPYTDDAYYRLRPTIGLRADRVRKVDDRYGFNPGMLGFERLYKDGKMAIVHGCGYPQQPLSHFQSMAYWHTAVPNGGERFGWLGRLADAIDPQLTPNFLVNIDERQSLAVQSEHHVPVVFDEPERFARKGLLQSRPLLDNPTVTDSTNVSGQYLDKVAASAREASQLVRAAWDNYKTPVDYGLRSLDLNKVAAMINAGLSSQLFYVSFRHNAFDTHVHQNEQHGRLLSYASDAIAGFMKDMDRIGRANDVTLVVFSEFGRRVAENTSLGTDHGTANHMYVIGKPVRGGHYGEPPSLTNLDADGNLKFTTDFRRVYASLIEGWLQHESKVLLRGDFNAFPLYG